MNEDLGQKGQRHPRCGRQTYTYVCYYCLGRDSNYRKQIDAIIRSVDEIFNSKSFEQWRADHQW